MGETRQNADKALQLTQQLNISKFRRGGTGAPCAYLKSFYFLILTLAGKL